MSVISPIQYPADKIGRMVRDGVIPAPTFDLDFARRRNFNAHQGRPVLTTGGTPTLSAAGAYIGAGDTISAGVGWLNQAEGAFLVEGDFDAVNQGSDQLILHANDGGATDFVRLYMVASTNDLVIQTVNSSGDNGFVQVDGVTAGVGYKYAATYANNDVVACLDGGTVGSDTTAGVPLADNITDLDIGTSPSGTTPTNGHIKRIVYWPRRLLNTTLQALTS